MFQNDKYGKAIKFYLLWKWTIKKQIVQISGFLELQRFHKKKFLHY